MLNIKNSTSFFKYFFTLKSPEIIVKKLSVHLRKTSKMNGFRKFCSVNGIIRSGAIVCIAIRNFVNFENLSLSTLYEKNTLIRFLYIKHYITKFHKKNFFNVSQNVKGTPESDLYARFCIKNYIFTTLVDFFHPILTYSEKLRRLIRLWPEPVCPLVDTYWIFKKRIKLPFF